MYVKINRKRELVIEKYVPEIPPRAWNIMSLADATTKYPKY